MDRAGQPARLDKFTEPAPVGAQHRRMVGEWLGSETLSADPDDFTYHAAMLVTEIGRRGHLAHGFVQPNYKDLPCNQ